MTNDFIWIDIETTGLDPSQDRILEVGIRVRDLSKSFIVPQPGDTLERMNPWCLEHHSQNGLIGEVLRVRSQEYIPEQGRSDLTPEQWTDNQIETWLYEVEAFAGSPMAGSSVHFDRAFIERYLPKTAGFFSYQNFDTRTLALLLNQYTPEVGPHYTALLKSKHRALEDLERSQDLLQFFIEKVLDKP